MFKIKHLSLLLITVLTLSIFGCKSQFERIRLSNDVAKKYQEAIRLYNTKNYSKALILFEDLSQKYRGRAEAEDLNYYYAYTLYRLGDYTTARFQFKNFFDIYPTSKNAEECRYMYAYCFYLDSPKSALEQDNTYKALDAMQLFINLYPKSDRVTQATKYINDLRGKLEDKAFTNAKLYFDMGGYEIANYKAAVVALKNAQIDYPDIKYAEEMDMLIVKSQYLYAKNSYETHQEERYTEAIGYANEFTEAHPQSKFSKDVLQLKTNSEAGIKNAQRILATVAAENAQYKAVLDRESKTDSTKTTIKTPIK
jgi:outer membrane protein assembly factor BamD